MRHAQNNPHIVLFPESLIFLFKSFFQLYVTQGLIKKEKANFPPQQHGIRAAAPPISRSSTDLWNLAYHSMHINMDVLLVFCFFSFLMVVLLLFFFSLFLFFF